MTFVLNPCLKLLDPAGFDEQAGSHFFSCKDKMDDTHILPSGPFRRMVVLGDSISYGMCAYRPENEWNQVVAGWLRRFQDVDLQVFNRGLPAEVISPACPVMKNRPSPR